jgi:hypothetical protein
MNEAKGDYLDVLLVIITSNYYHFMDNISNLLVI